MQPLIDALADPNVAFVLLVLGGLGLVLEVVHPNLMTGSIGAVSLALAFVGLASLPLDLAGLVFIAAGLVLFVVEASRPTNGLLTAGALACIAVGAITLYASPAAGSGRPVVAVAWPVIGGVLVAAGTLMVVALVAARRARRLAPPAGTVGTPLAAGLPGVVRRPLAPVGSVYAGGEEWSARTVDDRPLDRGTAVRIIALEGLTILVEPRDIAAPAP